MMMGYREYSRHRGVTLRAVQKAIENGRIVVNADKKIDSDIADRDWDANFDASRVAAVVAPRNALNPNRVVNTSHVKPEGQGDLLSSSNVDAQSADERSDEQLVSDAGASEYRGHRTKREEFQAKTKQLEYEQLAGLVINVDDAKRIAFTAFRVLRDSIMNVPARVKDQIAAETDPHACEMLIESELSAALAGIDVGKLLVEADEDDE